MLDSLPSLLPALYNALSNHRNFIELCKLVADAPSRLGGGNGGEPKALEYSNISRLLNGVER